MDGSDEAAKGQATDERLAEQLKLLDGVRLAYRQAGEGLPAEPGAWGPLRILGRLGEGSFGEVFRAHDAVLDRQVALKLARRSLGADAERRYLDEARRLARVRHANVVAVHGADVHGGRVGLWTDLVEGQTLEEVIEAQGPLGAREAALVGLDLCRALAAVHAQGLVHGDVKTGNVMRERGGRIVLMDFGTVKEVIPGGEAPVVTRGTPLVLAPELLRGEPLTPAADVYSMGVLLYHLVSGRYPVEAPTVLEAAAQHAQRAAVPLRERRPDLPEPFLQAVDRCLSPRPADRYQTPGELSGPLRETLGVAAETPAAGGRRGRERVAWAIAGAAVLVAAAIGVAGLRGALTRAPSLPTFQRLTFRPGVMPSARFAADGQTVVYTAAPAGGPLELFLARAGSPEARALGFTDARLVSLSRRDEIAYIRTRGHFPTNVGTLMRAPLAGGGSREVMTDVRDADWSPDGTELAVSRRVGNVEVLEFPIGRRLHEAPAIWSVRVAPDGQRVAFLRGAFSLTGVADLVVVDRAGHATTLIDKGPGALGLSWSPDGREIWFAAPPTAEVGEIEAVSLSGRRRTLARVLGAHSVLDVFKDGRALVAPTDVRGGLACARVGSGERDLSWLENDWAEDLSADGSRVLVSQNFAAGGPIGGVYVRPIDGSPAIRLGDGRPEALSPDGQWALATTSNDGGEWVLLPTGAGSPRPVDRGPVRTLLEADWLGDGRGIVVSGRDAAGATHVYLLDVENGALRPLLGDVTLPENAVTLDGRHFIGSDHGRWLLYSTDGGEPRPLPHLRPDDTPLQWSPDGRAIFVRRGGRNDAPPIAIERIDAATGQRTPWQTIVPRDPVGTIRLQPVLLRADGSAYCYTYQRLRSDIYLASGLR
jgi:Tol biopolymer transport system component